MNEKVVLDTNEWLNSPEKHQDYGSVIVPVTVLMELDRMKTEVGERGAKARQAIRFIEESKNIEFDPNNNIDKALDSLGWKATDDILIVSSAIRNGVPVVTNDANMRLVAKASGLTVINGTATKKFADDYSGVQEVRLTSDEASQSVLADFYETQSEYSLGLELAQNEYLLIWQDDQVIDRYKKIDNHLVKVKYKNLENKEIGKVSPRNEKQKLLFDLLQNDSITVKSCFGRFGTGKDFVMISHAVSYLMNNKFDKLIWVRNNVEVKDTNPIGFLPSDMLSKLMPFAMPLADHLGGVDGLKRMIDFEKIEVQHLGFMRGRDIKNSIIYVSECENNTREHIQLLLSRVGEGSQLWLNGDMRQIDSNKFTRSNGVTALKMLKGHKLYGQVTLDKTERSETASLADLLD